jgi:hypothetical protein
MNVEEKHFNSLDDFNKFKNKNGTKIKTYEILEEYCKNDVIITKKAIQMY